VLQRPSSWQSTVFMLSMCVCGNLRAADSRSKSAGSLSRISPADENTTSSTARSPPPPPSPAWRQ
jgi:hypothetical protein